MKKSTRIFISLFILVAFIVTIGVGCKTATTTTVAAETTAAETTKAAETTTTVAATTGEEVTLSVAYHWAGHYPKWSDYVKTSFEEKNPNIKINLLSWGVDNFLQMLNSSILAGTGPDVFGIIVPSNLEPIIEANAALDLTPYLSENNNEWGNTFRKGINDVWTYGDKVYAVTSSEWNMGMWYNKKIFNDLGIKPPKNTDELLAVAEVIKKAGLIPVATSGTQAEDLGYHYAWNMGANNVAWNLNKYEELVKGALACGPDYNWTTDPLIKTWADELIKIGSKNIFQDSIELTNHETSHSLFIQGKTAMAWDGNWIVSYLRSNATPEFCNNAEFTAWPSFDGSDFKQSVPFGHGEIWVVNANSPHLKEAIEYVKHATSKEVVSKGIEFGEITLPSILNVETKNIDPFIQKWMENTKDIEHIAGDIGSAANYAVVDQSLAMSKALEGGFKSTEELLAFLQSTTEQYYLGK